MFQSSSKEELEFVNKGEAIFREKYDITEDRYGRIIFLVSDNEEENSETNSESEEIEYSLPASPFAY